MDGSLRTYKMNFGGKSPGPVVVKKPDPLVKKDPAAVKKDDPNAAPEGLVATSDDLSSPITACFYSSDGKKIYAATVDGAIHVLDPLTLKEIAKHNVVGGKVVHAVAAPKSVVPAANLSKEWLYLLDERKQLLVFDTEKETVAKSVPMLKNLNDPNQTPSYKLTVTPDARTLIIVSKGGWEGVRWDLRTHAETVFAPLQQAPFNSVRSTNTVVFSADGRFGAASTSSKVLVWNAKSGANVAIFNSRFVYALAIVPEANMVIATGNGQPLTAWNYVTGKEVWNDQPATNGDSLVAIPKSKRVAYASQTELIIRDCVKGVDTYRWKSLVSPYYLAASSDGKYLVSVGRFERKVRLYAVPPATAKKP